MTEVVKATMPRSGDKKDANDYHQTPEVVVGALKKGKPMQTPTPKHPDDGEADIFGRYARRPPARDALRMTPEEWTAAKLTPKCIVPNHFYSDVAVNVAQGGTGKTTLQLWEAIHIILGIPLYGEKIENPGWVLFVTSEDRRERLVARTREICNAMELSAAQTEKVQRELLIWDVTQAPVKLAMEHDGNILITPLAQYLAEAYSDHPPVMAIFDPTVSFGVSEQKVNDNEQALITAARVITGGLDCCTRFTHHTGKGNARAGAVDQYASRGGSALPDGARMVHVMQTWDAKESKERPPIKLDIGKQTGVLKIHRAKLSYAPPGLPVIWIARNGFLFEWAEELKQTPEQIASAQVEQVLQFLRAEIKQERYHSKANVEAQRTALDMSRDEIRAALAELEVSGRIVHYDLPEEQRHGGRQHYLSPRDMPPANPARYREVGENDDATTF